MNLGQTMLTAGMLLLLIMTAISANRMISENTGAQFQAEALTSSASIANDVLLEIMSKRYDGLPDSTTLVKGTLATTAFSPFDSLQVTPEWGPSAAERSALNEADTLGTDSTYKSVKGFNDIDDYAGYQRTVNFGNITGFIVRVNVYYVTAAAPDVFSKNRTFFKKIEVSVEHPLYLPRVKYTSLASY